jgi:hypothetical protein
MTYTSSICLKHQHEKTEVFEKQSDVNSSNMIHFSLLLLILTDLLCTIMPEASVGQSYLDCLVPLTCFDSHQDTYPYCRNTCQCRLLTEVSGSWHHEQHSLCSYAV